MHNQFTPFPLPNPSGKCMCECGGVTSVAKKTSTKDKAIRGEHVRYIPGHEHIRPLWDRFWEKVIIPSKHSCWRWNAAFYKNGYGKIGEGTRAGRNLLAHRVAYEFVLGDIPEGLDLDHLCRNRWCVNPYHLEPVTRKENLRRGDYVKGTRCHMAKLDEDDVRSVRKLSRGGMATPDIARLFDVTAGTIRLILNGKNWKHVV